MEKGKPLIWFEEGEEEISSFLSHTCNDSKRGEKSKEKGENGEKMKEKKERG